MFPVETVSFVPPPELMSKIFRELWLLSESPSSFLEANLFLVTATHVNRSWRAFAIQDSYLWSAFDVGPRLTLMSDAYRTRSRESALRIRLRVDSSLFHPNSNMISFLRTISHRIKALHITFHSANDLHRLANLDITFPRLTCFETAHAVPESLQMPSPQKIFTAETFGGALAHLERAAFFNPDLFSASLVQRSLRELSFEKIEYIGMTFIEMLIDILPHLPDLRALSIIGTFRGQASSLNRSPHTPTVLRSLDKFQFEIQFRRRYGDDPSSSLPASMVNSLVEAISFSPSCINLHMPLRDFWMLDENACRVLRSLPSNGGSTRLFLQVNRLGVKVATFSYDYLRSEYVERVSYNLTRGSFQDHGMYDTALILIRMLKFNNVRVFVLSVDKLNQHEARIDPLHTRVTFWKEMFGCLPSLKELRYTGPSDHLFAILRTITPRRIVDPLRCELLGDLHIKLTEVWAAPFGSSLLVYFECRAARLRQKFGRLQVNACRKDFGSDAALDLQNYIEKVEFNRRSFSTPLLNRSA